MGRRVGGWSMARRQEGGEVGGEGYGDDWEMIGVWLRRPTGAPRLWCHKWGKVYDRTDGKSLDNRGGMRNDPTEGRPRGRVTS